MSSSEEHNKMLELLLRIRAVHPASRIFPCQDKVAKNWQRKFRENITEFEFPKSCKPGIVPGDIGYIVIDVDSKEIERKHGVHEDPFADEIDVTEEEDKTVTYLRYSPEKAIEKRKRGIEIAISLYGEPSLLVDSASKNSHGCHLYYPAKKNLADIAGMPKSRRPIKESLQFEWEVGETRFKDGYVCIHSQDALTKITEQLVEGKPKNFNEITLQDFLSLATKFPKVDTKVKSKPSTKTKQKKELQDIPSSNDGKDCMPREVLESMFSAQIEAVKRLEDEPEVIKLAMKAVSCGVPLIGLENVKEKLLEAIKCSNVYERYAKDCERAVTSQVDDYVSKGTRIFKCLEEEIWNEIGSKAYFGAEKLYLSTKTDHESVEVGKLSRSSLNDMLGAFITKNSAIKMKKEDKSAMLETIRNRIRIEHGFNETTHQLFAPIVVKTKNGRRKLNTGTCQPVNTKPVNPEENHGLIWMPEGMKSIDCHEEDHLTPFFEDFVYRYMVALYGAEPNEEGHSPLDAIILNLSRIYINALSGNLGLLQIRPVFQYGPTRIGKGWIPKWFNRQVLGLDSEYYINSQLIYGGKFNAEGAYSPIWIYQDPTKHNINAPPPMEVIKQWITEREVTHEKKGVDAVQVRLCPAIWGSVNIDELDKLKVKPEDSFISKVNVVGVSNPVEVDDQFYLKTSEPEESFKDSAARFQKGLVQWHFNNLIENPPQNKDQQSYGVQHYVGEEMMDQLREISGYNRAEGFLYFLEKESSENIKAVISKEDVHSDDICAEISKYKESEEYYLRIPTQAIANHLNRKINKDNPASNLQKAYHGWKENSQITVRSINDFIKHEKRMIPHRCNCRVSTECKLEDRQKVAWIYMPIPNHLHVDEDAIQSV